MTRPFCRALIRTLTVASLATVGAGGLAVERPGVDLFERSIRPVLERHCYECHSGRAKELKGELRLDTAAGLRRGGTRGPAVVPGDVDASWVVRALRHVDGDLRMPPDGKLSGHVLRDFERWIEAGAPDPRSDLDRIGLPDDPGEAAADHWAFQPVRAPSLPDVRRADWPRTAIDRFVLARLEAKGLDPSPRADRRTLARRAYHDLVGLPPTRAEIDAFLRDEAPGAFARLVDRLLASPRHGERWGRHWLDIARYADTKGYVDGGATRYAFAWTYRDYVIRAFNEDLPYDRFVVEQLAADRLLERRREPGDDRDAMSQRDLAAMGFLTVGPRFNLFPHEIIDDRIDVVTRGLLGLTVSCARCHDHKYDPITMADYYGLYGVFASSREPSPEELPVIPGTLRPAETAGDGPKEPEALREKLSEAARNYHERRRELHGQIQHEMRAWAGDYLRYIVQTTPGHRTQAQPPLRTERGRIRVFSAYASGGVIRWRRFIAARGVDDPVFGFWNRVVALPREEVPGRAPEILVELAGEGAMNPLLAQACEVARPSSMVDLADVYGALLEETDSLWRQKLEAEPASDGFDDPAREELRQVLYGADAPGTLTLDESADLYQLGESSDMRKRYADIERVLLGSREALPRAMVLGDREQPVEPRIFERGDANRPGERVERRFLRCLAGVREAPFRDGSGRLELARAIVDEKNPLTARVIVNRVWAWHFGKGLVRTPGDFGARSSPPTHPDLLDHLASSFMDDGWSLKRLHRRILLSAAWQQASDDRPACRALDPENELLWRANRRRLGFEAMRDAMLAVSGRLSSAMGGPPVRQAPDDPGHGTRTVYCDVDRENLPGVFRVFDFPSPDILAPRRSRTTVPQQALFLLNSPFVIAQARSLARWLDEWLAPGDLDGRIEALFSRVHARAPRDEEQELARRFVEGRGEDLAQEKQDIAEASRAWAYGYGEYDEASERLRSFTPLPHFNGEAWQGGERWPDPRLHYLRLTAQGGHVGIDRQHAAVRRWTAPRDGMITVHGTLEHLDESCGDGVRGIVSLSTRGRELGRWTVFKSETGTAVDAVAVVAGDAIDFVVDCRKNHLCDLFRWSPVIRYLPGEPDDGRDGRGVWHAERDFSGDDTAGGEMSPWAELAQVLLQSSEFLFVD